MRTPALLLALALVGCAEYPREVGRAPDLEPPPARDGTPLTRAQAFEIARDADLDEAIQRLDGSRFGFVLDAPTIEWFQRQGAPEEVVDYLKKRRRVDWAQLRGDIDPATPELQYVDPRRGFEDFAGFGFRESYAGYRSLNPFAH